MVNASMRDPRAIHDCIHRWKHMGDRNQWLSMIEVPKGVIAELVFTDTMIMQ